jgi:hypothetical protein
MKKDIKITKLNLNMTKAKCVNGGSWFYGILWKCIEDGKYYITNEHFTILQEIVIETAVHYTGYVDKNNVMIYDKDIIKIGNDEEQYVVIYYDDEHIDVITLDEYKKGYELVSFDLSAISDNCLVCGNLYDSL